MNKRILVYAHWKGLERPELFGTLFTDAGRTGEVFSFSYDNQWIISHAKQNFLDPDLQLFKGRQYPKPGNGLFGLFFDSCPDRWGRMLMQRREVFVSHREKRPVKHLTESDFLLGVHDIARMGALRFKLEGSDTFLSQDTHLASPPWARLRELEQGCSKLEDSKTPSEDAYWLSLLVEPGSSLGGARPKATVQDQNNHLWIAKFPSNHDFLDTGAWEMVIHDLAVNAGIVVPSASLEKFSERGSTYLSKRFDRTETNERVHFASAMALLGKHDGENLSSYLELAEFLMQYGSKPEEDLRQLWRRIVFNIAVSNTDDHLRNHGFLLDEKGWRISPAYDLNASTDKTGLHLAIDEYDHSLDFQVALKVAPHFRLSRPEALQVLKEVVKATGEWKVLAKRYQIPEGQYDYMQSAFKIYRD